MCWISGAEQIRLASVTAAGKSVESCMERQYSMYIHNILTIDDEVANLNALKRIFNPDYNVFSATNCKDALAIMESEEIALILADHKMPGMTGIEFMEEIRHRYPDTVRIIITGYTDEKLLMDAINVGHVYSFISKPWDVEELRDVVNRGIEVYERSLAYRMPHIRALLYSEIISTEQLTNALRIRRAEKKPIGEILLELGKISREQLEAGMKLQKSKREKLGKILIKLGFISPDDLQMAYERQKRMERSLVEILIDMGYASEEKILSCYALNLGMPPISIPQFSSIHEVIDLLPSDLAHKHSIVPVDMVGRVLVVAASEPLSDGSIGEVEEATGYRVMVAYSPRSEIRMALEQHYAHV